MIVVARECPPRPAALPNAAGEAFSAPVRSCGRWNSVPAAHWVNLPPVWGAADACNANPVARREDNARRTQGGRFVGLVTSMASSAELETRLSELGVPPQGRDWLRKALHPAGPGAPGVAVPDCTSLPTARPEYVVERVVGAPPSLETPTWDCIMYTLPGNVTACVVETAPAGTDFGARVAPGPVVGGTLTVLRNQENVYGGTIVGYGTVTGAGYSTVGFTAETRPVSWRAAYRSLTVYMSASAISDQGTVTSGQFPGNQVTATDALNVWRDTPPPPYFGHSIQSNFYLPMNEADMLLGNPMCRVAAAREGVYIPVRMQGPDAKYAISPSSSAMIDVTTGGNIILASSATVYRGSHWSVSALLGGAPQTTSYVVEGLPPVPVPGGGRPVLVDDGFDNFLCTVTIWRGLSPSATLTVKSVVGLEVAVGPESPIRAFVKPPLPPIPSALAAYYGIIAVAPQVYPSSHNVFGAILPLLSSVAKMAAPFVLPLVGAGVSRLGQYIAGKGAGSGTAAPPAPPAEKRRVGRAPSLRRTVPPSARARSSSVGSRSTRSGRAPSVKVVVPRRRRR